MQKNEKRYLVFISLYNSVSKCSIKARRNFYLIMVNKSVSIIRWKLIQSAFDGVANIKKQKYGVTNEGRDLNVYFISTPENLANLV
jgi:hypothetical protein